MYWRTNPRTSRLALSSLALAADMNSAFSARGMRVTSCVGSLAIFLFFVSAFLFMIVFRCIDTLVLNV